MANRRLSMRNIKDVLRLALHARLEHRKIARSLGISHNTVSEYIRRARVAGLPWPLPAEMDEVALERLLFPPLPSSREARPIPDWSAIHTELKKTKGVTLTLLWQEYREVYPDGFGQTAFWNRYTAWRGKLDLVMRQEHRAGEKLFVDYAGPMMPVVNPVTGEIRDASIFVAVLGASSYTFAEATWTQAQADWIGSHVRAFEFFGGVAELIIPDNLKTGVSKACRYEPDLHPNYQDMASHYGAAIIPARVRKPRDKAKVEAGVQLVERWIMARLRNVTFFSLAELNKAIAALLAELNERRFRKLPGSRKSVFESIERPALLPLPEARYEVIDWKKARVNIDYHIEFDGHYYSVPYVLVKKEVEVRATATTLEILFGGNRVASHVRNRRAGKHTTIKEHMPDSHRRHAEWTPSRLIGWAQKVGPHTAELVTEIMEHRPHPEQGFRSCLGIMRLLKEYPPDRLENACRRALAFQGYSYKSVRSILSTGMDRLPENDQKNVETTVVAHENIRGPHYYH